MLPAASGVPLIKSTPLLERMLVWRKGRSVVDVDMPDHLRKEHVRRDFETFVAWMRKEDGAEYVQGSVRVSGPYPYLKAREPDIQHGDAGGHRPVARNAQGDVDQGKESYEIECLFRVVEAIQEVPTDLAIEMFGKGRAGLRPLRSNEWRAKGANSWSPRP